MNNMGKREKTLLVITIVVVLVYAAWSFGVEKVFDSAFSGNSAVASAENRFKDNLDALGDIYMIEREYRRVGDLPKADDKNLSPALAFTAHVSDMCKRHVFDFPPIKPDVEEIKDVDDYELVNVAVRTEGTFANTVKLLLTFEDNGLIFREVDLKSTRDKDIVTARVTVARIAEKQQPRGRLGVRRP